MNAATIVALVVALGGWALAGITTWLSYKTKTEENFYRALDWLSGGTQKRNLGIAAIEASWHLRRVQRLSTPLLCSSAVYLLLRSHQDDSPNELNNLYRIMNMITGAVRVRQEHEFHYRMLVDALEEKLKPGPAAGLKVPDEIVARWRSEMIAALGRSTIDPQIEA